MPRASKETRIYRADALNGNLLSVEEREKLVQVLAQAPKIMSYHILTMFVLAISADSSLEIPYEEN